MNRLLKVMVLTGILSLSLLTNADAASRWPWYLPPIPVPVPVIVPTPPAVVIGPAQPARDYDYYDGGLRYGEQIRQQGYSDGYSDGYNLYRHSYAPSYRDYRAYRLGYNRGFRAGMDRRYADNEIRERRYYRGDYDRDCDNGHHDHRRCDD